MDEVDHKALSEQLDILADQFERGTIASDQYYLLRRTTVEAWIANWQNQNCIKKNNRIDMRGYWAILAVVVALLGTVVYFGL